MADFRQLRPTQDPLDAKLAKTIYLLHNGQQTGPFTEQELRRHWAHGNVSPDHLVWQQGMADYVSLRDFFGGPARRLAEVVPARNSAIRAENILEEPTRAMAGSETKLWVMQLGCWILPLIATGLLLSLPENMWVGGILYLLSLILAIVTLAHHRSAGNWLALAANVAVPAALWFLLLAPRLRERVPTRPPVSNVEAVSKQNVG